MFVDKVPKKRWSKIKGLILDVDGVLTDCRVWWNGHDWVRQFCVRDGMGIKLLLRSGYKLGVLTGSASPDVSQRMQFLGVEYFYGGLEDKGPTFNKFLQKYHLHADEVVGVGDDVQDIVFLEKCGIAVRVPDAVAKVKKLTTISTRQTGGFGAAREVIDMILENGKLRS